MHIRFAGALAALLLFVTAPVPAQTFTVPVEYFKLDNGLKVVVSPDQSAPVVLVEVMYNIGFRVEPKGRTGFAHLFEHMMFQGSANVKKIEHVSLMQEAGGNVNGSTRFDYTNYYQVAAGERARARALARGRPHALARRQRREPQEPAERGQRRGPRQRAQPAARRLSSGSRSGSAPTRTGTTPTTSTASSPSSRRRRSRTCGRSSRPTTRRTTPCSWWPATPRPPKSGARREALRIDSAPAAAAARRHRPSRRRRRRRISRAPTSWRARRRMAVAWHLPPRMSKDFFALSVLDPLLNSDNSARMYRKLVRDERLAMRGMAASIFSARTGT